MFLNKENIDLSKMAIKDAYGNAFTYFDLEKLAEDYAKVVKSRSLVMILCDHEIDTVAFYYCMLVNHTVPILVDAYLSEEILRELIRRYHPHYIWKSMYKGDEVILKKEKHVLMKMYDEEISMHQDLALLLTTSGTTGSSKLVRISYDNLLSNARASSEHVMLRQDDATITTLPFYYCYGLAVMHFHWYMGATVYVTDWPITSEKFWVFFKESKITNFAVVPYHLEILTRIEFIKQDYQAFRFLMVGGGKLPEEIQSSFGKMLKNKGIRFYILYGQTEGTSILSGIPYEKALEKIGSVGLALTGFTAEIGHIDEHSVGELVFYGNSVSMGYAEKIEDLAKGDENNGILYTGDLAYMDEKGYIYLKGRKKRFVKILGIRISLDEMENIIRRYYPEENIVCAGSDNHIVLFHESMLDEKELIKFCEKKFSIRKKMIEAKMIEKIPRNSYGKVKYSVLNGEEN